MCALVSRSLFATTTCERNGEKQCGDKFQLGHKFCISRANRGKKTKKRTLSKHIFHAKQLIAHIIIVNGQEMSTTLPDGASKNIQMM